LSDFFAHDADVFVALDLFVEGLLNSFAVSDKWHGISEGQWAGVCCQLTKIKDQMSVASGCGMNVVTICFKLKKERFVAF
jgi:hypothetical protein